MNKPKGSITLIWFTLRTSRVLFSALKATFSHRKCCGARVGTLWKASTKLRSFIWAQRGDSQSNDALGTGTWNMLSVNRSSPFITSTRGGPRVCRAEFALCLVQWIVCALSCFSEANLGSCFPAFVKLQGSSCLRSHLEILTMKVSRCNE